MSHKNDDFHHPSTKTNETLSKSIVFERQQKSANSQGHPNFFEDQRVQIMPSAVFYHSRLTCAFCIVKHRSKRILHCKTQEMSTVGPRIQGSVQIFDVSRTDPTFTYSIIQPPFCTQEGGGGLNSKYITINLDIDLDFDP